MPFTPKLLSIAPELLYCTSVNWLAPVLFDCPPATIFPDGVITTSLQKSKVLLVKLVVVMPPLPNDASRLPSEL